MQGDQVRARGRGVGDLVDVRLPRSAHVARLVLLRPRRADQAGGRPVEPRLRGVALDDETRTTIESSDDPSRLEAWLINAATATTASDVITTP